MKVVRHYVSSTKSRGKLSNVTKNISEDGASPSGTFPHSGVLVRENQKQGCLLQNQAIEDYQFNLLGRQHL